MRMSFRIWVLVQQFSVLSQAFSPVANWQPFKNQLPAVGQHHYIHWAHVGPQGLADFETLLVVLKSAP